jgi:predicted permease
VKEVDLSGRDLMAMGWIFGALNLVLLISCANVMTLLLSRAAARKREIAVRLCLGAPRIRLVRMLITESVLLAAIAGAASLYLATRVPERLFEFVAKRPADFPMPTDWRVFAYVAGVVLAAGCLSGLAPALESLKVNLTASLKGHANALPGMSSGTWMHDLLVAAQVALSLVLLVGAGLFAQAEYRILRNDPGYQPWKVVISAIHIPENNTQAASRSMFHIIHDRLMAVPGVRAVSYCDWPPLLEHDTVEIPRHDRSSGAMETVDVYSASPGFFQTMGIPILRGREFEESDQKAVIVSDELARTMWPKEDPLGKKLELPDGAAQIVGVARNISPMRFGGTENPPAYRMSPLNANRTVMLTRFENSPPSVAAVRSAVRSVYPETPTLGRVFQKWIDEIMEILWNLVSLIVALGTVGIVLATTGIYGAVAFAVSQRTKDMGIRMALGARRLDIVREVFLTGGRPVLEGVLVGLWLSLVAATGLKQTFKTTPIQLDSAAPSVYVGAAVLLVVAGMAAMLAPARRAARCDPVETLRSE